MAIRSIIISYADNNSFSLDQLKAEKVRQGEEEQLRTYEPHAAQTLMHKSQAGQRALFGANQCGKTYSGTVEILYTVGKCHPYRPNYVGPVRARDCCVTFNAIESILIPTYKMLAPRGPCTLDWNTFEGKPAMWPGLYKGSWDKAFSKESKVLRLADGGFIEFKTYEQGREAMQGARIHIIRHDEEPTEEIYEENLARQVTLQTNILFTLTPLNYSQWLYERLYQLGASDSTIETFKMSIYESPYASLESIAALEKACTDPAIRAARLYGEFTFLSGRVYKEYGEHNLVTPFPVPDHWERTVVIDPHLSKATAVNLYADDPQTGVTYCIAEGDFEGDVPGICSQIEVMCGQQRINKWLIDPSSKAEARIHGKGRLLDSFRKRFHGLIVANNARDLGIDAVRQMVKPRNGGSKFRVFKSCPISHHQMLNYMWKKPLKSGEDRNKPEVHKRKDDHPDNHRYKIMSLPNANNGASFSGFGVRMIN